MRAEFNKKIKDIQKDLSKMGSEIVISIDMTLKAVVGNDTALSKEVIARDNIIDEYERGIENKCLQLILMEQPVASDLRKVMSILKIITDFERIADYCADICVHIVELEGEIYKRELSIIPKMVEKVKIMVEKTIEAFIEKDQEKAKLVCESDDIVDDLFDEVVLSLQNLISSDITAVKQATYFLLIAKYLERMADHSTNVCEWIVYIVTGVHEEFN